MASSSQERRAHLPESREDVRHIFLSHSGYQKDFVQNLHDALERANQKPFLDVTNLLKASPFPEQIKRAVRHCKLGVVVLSDGFMMSKWPMLELEMFFQEGKPILPLFYKLQTEDLKSDKHLTRWRKKWEMILTMPAERRSLLKVRAEKETMLKARAERVAKWDGFVRSLCAINGIVFKQQQTENSYIETVVTEICKLVPCQPVYNLPSIQGFQDLAKEVEKLFEERKCEGPRMVGLHGVGGLGKTTLCMSMVNFYGLLYNGRSYLIEFPTDGDKSTVLRVCKKFLKKLGSPKDDVLKGIDKLEQVAQLMKDLVGRHDIFLAFDNVWPKTEKAAELLLSVGFSAASKILLTSQSDQVLWNLLDDCTNENKNSYVGPLPALKREDALKIFEQSLGGFTLPVRNQMDNLVEKCKFSGNYHPLALQALGKYVRKSLDVSGLEMPRVLEEINQICLETVENSIKINYELLSEDMKCMFLDIALLIECKIYEPFKYVYSKKGLENALVRCLCFLDEERLMSKVHQMIHGLAEAGVIQRKADKVGQKMIQVHDLYLELAQNEAARSPRFLTSPKAVEGVDWPQLERLKTFEEGEDYHFIKKLQLQRCLKLKFCFCSNIQIPRPIQMMSMPSLCILLMSLRPPTQGCIGRRNLMQSVGAPSKVYLGGCQKLAFVWLEYCPFEHIDGLSALRNLQMLFISTCPYLKNLDGLSSLMKLEILAVVNCDELEKLPDLGGLTGLERLTLHDNDSLEEVGYLGTALKEVTISCCLALMKLPDFDGSTGLKRLTLDGNKSLEEVGCLGAALKEVTISGCRGLKKSPDFGGLTGLERLMLKNNESLEEVGCVGAAPKAVTISRCLALKKFPDFGGSTGFERLTLDGNESLEEVGCTDAALKEVIISGCPALKKLADFGGSTGFERLTLDGNESLEEVGCVGAALKEVTISGCPALKMLPDFGGSTGLERLTLDGNESLEEVGFLVAALKEVTISGCRGVKKLPDFGGLTGLERLTLKNNESLEEVGCVGAALKEVTISGCPALEKLPNFGGSTGLERLTLDGNESLEEVGCLAAALKEVTISGCRGVKKLPDFGSLTGLERLTLKNNESLEEVGCLGAALKELTISYCPALELPDVAGLTGLQRLTLENPKSLEEVG